MIKSVALLKRKPGLTDEEFYWHWKEIHGPLAVKIVPGLRKYVQNHSVAFPRVKNEFDGFAEVWFDDLEALENFFAWRQTDEAKALLDDENKFLDMSQTIRCIASEHVIV